MTGPVLAWDALMMNGTIAILDHLHKPFVINKTGVAPHCVKMKTALLITLIKKDLANHMTFASCTMKIVIHACNPTHHTCR